MPFRTSSGSDTVTSGAAADAAAALKAIAEGKPVQIVNDQWTATADMRRESAEALRMVQENCNY
eukprot:774894-Rhodomonas_salina.1